MFDLFIRSELLTLMILLFNGGAVVHNKHALLSFILDLPHLLSEPSFISYISQNTKGKICMIFFFFASSSQGMEI